MALIVAALCSAPRSRAARRWIFGIQPSEFIKPAFVVLAAWAFSEGGRAASTACRPISWLSDPAADNRAAGAATRFRPDDADLGRLGGAVLHGRAALVLGRRDRRRRRLRRLRGLQLSPHVRERIVHFSIPMRAAAWSTRSRSTPRSRAFSLGAGSGGAGGRDLQAHPAGHPYGFRFRGDRRGIRHHHLHRARSRSSPSSCCAADASRRATRIRSAASPRRA